jgi:hypothetical protein
MFSVTADIADKKNADDSIIRVINSRMVFQSLHKSTQKDIKKAFR